MDIVTLLWAILPSLFVAVVMAFFNRGQKKRDEHRASYEAARKQEMMLHLQLQMATADLSYAVAMAIKRGSPNGEVEAGIKAYDEARAEYDKFLNKQAAEFMCDTY